MYGPNTYPPYNYPPPPHWFYPLPSQPGDKKSKKASMRDFMRMYDDWETFMKKRKEEEEKNKKKDDKKPEEKKRSPLETFMLFTMFAPIVGMLYLYGFTYVAYKSMAMLQAAMPIMK